MLDRNLSFIDKILIQADNALRTLGGHSVADRASPAEGHTEGELTISQRRLASRLMRVNHTGEVCAQALYQGQALTAKLNEVREDMEKAAEEETDHLVWCEERLNELESSTSILNPLWYALSFGIGFVAGKISDEVSLGFVAATEDRVVMHLKDHLNKLPEEDRKSRLVLQQMLHDEECHGEAAKKAGAAEFPKFVKDAMSHLSKFMTKTTYWI